MRGRRRFRNSQTPQQETPPKCAAYLTARIPNVAESNDLNRVWVKFLPLGQIARATNPYRIDRAEVLASGTGVAPDVVSRFSLVNAQRSVVKVKQSPKCPSAGRGERRFHTVRYTKKIFHLTAVLA
jgi:hypothetical protein